MILILVQLSFPVLAGLGIMKIISLKNEKNIKWEKIIKNSAFIFTGIFVLSLLLSGPLSEWFSSRVAEAGQKGQQLKPLYEYMSEMFLSDLYIGFIFLSVIFWSAHFYLNEKLSSHLLIIIVAAVSIIDLWRIDYRAAQYKDNPEITNQFEPPAYVTEIKNREKEINQPFRLLNIKQDGTPGSLNGNQNYHVYFLLEDFYGYSGIKPRTYQDLLDIVGPGNPTLWRMLNVKYIITDKPVNAPGFNSTILDEKTALLVNENALPRVYFVNTIKTAPMLEVLNLIKTNAFDPKETVYLEDETLNVDIPDSTASVNIIEYKNEYMKVEAKASGNNFLFIGNTFYPLGWKAKIDGKETEIHKANHGFMGVVVPQGNHAIELIYTPESFYTGKYISLILNSLLIVAFVMIVFLNRKVSLSKQTLTEKRNAE